MCIHEGSISVALRAAVKRIMTSHNDKSRLRISILNTFEERDNDGLYTVYIIRTLDPINQVHWDRGHRFSHFLRLRKELQKRGFESLPKILGTSWIGSSVDPALVQYRITGRLTTAPFFFIICTCLRGYVWFRSCKFCAKACSANRVL